MAEEKKEEKKDEKKEEGIILEREYIVPLRIKWKKTPKYKRAPKAIKALKHFLAKHMKVEERDTNKILIDKLLNEEIWFRGIKKPPAKIKVKAKKYSDGKVRVELVDLPEVLKWKVERAKKKEAKKAEIAKKAAPTSPEAGKAEEDKRTEEEKAEEKEKEKSMAEKEAKDAKSKAKQQRHQAKVKKGIKKPLARKALKK
jgi:large subunit ribosomal protein L31e